MKKIDAFKNYIIFKNGKIKNVVTGIYPSQFIRSGYPSAVLSKDGSRATQKIRPIHRLLAIAFIPNPKNYKVVNHKNGNKLDYRLCNLEWCSVSHNNKHAFLTGLNVPKSGEQSHAAKLTAFKVRQIRYLLEYTNLSQKDIGLLYGVSRGCILSIKHNRTWKNTK